MAQKQTALVPGPHEGRSLQKALGQRTETTGPGQMDQAKSVEQNGPDKIAGPSGLQVGIGY